MHKGGGSFTITDLLVAIGILGIFIIIALFLINPKNKLTEANNTARSHGVNTLLSSIHQYARDNNGDLPANMPGRGMVAENISSEEADICLDILPTYVIELPTDPMLNVPAVSDCTVAYDTGYQVSVDASGRVTVAASGAEDVGGTTPIISVTR